MTEEFEFIDWIRTHRPQPLELEIDIGDDCAALSTRANELCLVTTDMLVDRTHFDTTKDAPEEIGWKAAAVSLSDCAAMAVWPTALVVGAFFPEGISRSFLERLCRGLFRCCEEFRVALAGGDTASGEGLLTLCTTALAFADQGRPVTRSGAQAGDAIFVTGRLGGSLLGRHLSFRPRLYEARWLRNHAEIHSMIDISDGLASEIRHICRASNIGATLEAEKIPISIEATQIADSERSALEHALGDGEDFELLFTVGAEETETLPRKWPFDTPLTLIGRIVEGDEISLRFPDGKVAPLPQGGYRHYFG